jgi:hypothetical protein
MLKYNAFYLSCALALTVALFLIGGQPGAGNAFEGGWHWIAHIATYAVIAASYASGFPRVPVLLIGGWVAAIGGLHEVYEIGSHGHDFEFDDFLVNAMASFGGSALSRYGARRAKAHRP